MEFTNIELGKEIEIPAVPAKVFNRKFLSHIRINSTCVDGDNVSHVIVHAVPFNGTDTLAEPKEYMEIKNIFADIQNPEQPEALRMLKAQVMEGIFQLYNAEVAYQKEVAKLAEEARLAKEEEDRLNPPEDII